MVDGRNEEDEVLKEAEMEIEERVTLKSGCNIHFAFDTSDVNKEATIKCKL